MRKRKDGSFVYRVDEDDRITFVNSQWLALARASEASELDRPAVHGRPLFDFIADEETRYLYRVMMTKVRQTGHAVSVPCRCDAPGMRRFFRLTVAPRPNGELEFTTVLVREEPRSPVPLLDPSVDRSADFLVLCSWCQRVKVSDDWIELETAVERLELFHSATVPQLTHGVCDGCRARIAR